MNPGDLGALRPSTLLPSATRALGSLSTWPIEHDLLRSRLVVAVLVLQGSLCIVAALTLVALYGDGAWFVFTVADGHAWTLKWAQLASRASAYVTVAAPVSVLSEYLHLSGRQIAAVYGLTFNLVQFIQMLVCVLLARRSYRRYLIFPISQYVFASMLGFGYMSEALLGPGFFWIGFFLILRQPTSLVRVAACLAGLVFSHEFMLPSALVLAVFAWQQQRSVSGHGRTIGREAIPVILYSGVFAAWIAVRFMAGKQDSDQNTIAALDPRRVINDPTLWCLLLVVPPIFLRYREIAHLTRQDVLLVSVACVAIPLMLSPWLNFSDGRYHSARALSGCELLFLGGWAISARVYSSRQPPFVDTKQDGRDGAWISIVIIAAVAINVGSSAAFLWDWTIAEGGFERLARSQTNVVSSNATSSELVPYQSGSSLLTPREVAANERLGFNWTWPFRTFILSPDGRPAISIYDPESLYFVCSLFRPLESSPSHTLVAAIDELRALSCKAQPPAERTRLYRRILDRLRAMVHEI